MPRLHRQPPSWHRINLHKMKAGRKSSGKHAVAPEKRKPLGQSFLGKVSIFFALVSLFLLGVEALLKFKASQGSTVAFDALRPYVLPGEVFGTLIGFACGVFSFGLSSKRQRNAVLGLILNFSVLVGWFVARSYLRVN